MEDPDNGIIYSIQTDPNIEELSRLLDSAFSDLTPEDQNRFDTENKGQSLSEWFDVNQVKDYLKHGFLIEARDNKNILAGVVLVGKQNPLSWPDGNKTEMFVLAVDSAFRGRGIGSTLVKNAEIYSKKMGAKKLVLNTHVLLEADHIFYEKLGFVKMGTLKDFYGNGDAIFYSKKLE